MPFVYNLNAVLVVMVIYAGDALFTKFHEQVPKTLKDYTFQDNCMLFLLGLIFFVVCRRQGRACAWPGSGPGFGL